jgi:hypothetical protein
LERGAEADISGGSAYLDFEGAGVGYPVFVFGAPVGEGGAVEGEGDGLGFAGLQVNALKAL